MTGNLAGNVRCISGVYQEEFDKDGQFQWIAERVEIQVDPLDGVLLLCGESLISNVVKICTPQTSYTVCIQQGSSRIAIPILSSRKTQMVTLVFSNRPDVQGDLRSLCFKVREFEFRLLGASSKLIRKTIPQVLGRGLLAGSVSTMFSEGWLRMHATLSDTGLLQVSGILFPPRYRNDFAVLTANGEVVSDIRYGLVNPDYEYLGPVGFEGVLDLGCYVDRSNIRFGSVFASDRLSATPIYQDWIWPLEATNLNVPSVQHMKRIGAQEISWFLFSGAGFVGKLHDVTGFASCREKRVLDWGCGCGRLTRHLVDNGYQEVVGADIDSVNIKWCNSNLPGATFVLISPELPTQFPESHFDLIIGHSVFTHLTEVDQFLWLAELNRLLMPGGYAVVTVMAGYSAAIEQFAEKDYMELQSYGFLDVGWQDDGVDDQKPGYYRRIFHTVDYVLENWTSFFEVTSVLEGYSDHQAAIVLRKLDA